MSTFSARVDNSNSFHPVSRTSFDLSPSHTHLVSSNCSLHLYYRLPPSLFIDPYELGQRQQSYTFVKWGHGDLEKPVQAVQGSDTDVLVNVNTPPAWADNTAAQAKRDVDVPLHARYGVPLPSTTPRTGAGNYYDVVLEAPKAFIACPSGMLSEDHQGSSTPPAYLSEAQLRELDVNIETTFFVHIPYFSSPNTVDPIRIPIGHSDDLYWVQPGTAVVIFLSFLWISTTAIQTAVRLASVRRGNNTKGD